MTSEDDLRRLANGVLWPGFLGRSAPAWLLDELRAGLAGVVYFAQNVGDELERLSSDLRAANPDILIGIDEEGGSVTRLETTNGSTVLGAAQLGFLDDLDATRATGAEIARRLQAVGVNAQLGPDVDVNTDPRNPVIGVRAFGDDAELVSRHGVAQVEGIQASGAVAACVKHFPGHGDTHLDSHHDLPTLRLTEQQLAEHRAPFVAAIAAGVDMIMTAHIVIEQFGPLPATLNAEILGGLRADGFEGVIVTDALDMAAIRETYGLGAGAVMALQAGADLLCIGNPTNPGDAMAPDQDERDFFAVQSAVIAALRDGTLSHETVQAAGERVADLGRRLASVRPDGDATVFDAQELADRAVTVRAGESLAPAPSAVVVDARKRASFAVDSAASYVSTVLAAGGTVLRIDPDRATDAERAAAIAAAVADAAARIIVLVDRVAVDPSQRDVVSAIASTGADAVVVNTGIPLADDAAQWPIPLVEVRASSRLAALAARRLLVRD